MSGNHEEIRPLGVVNGRWKKTFRNRPDLLEGALLNREEPRFSSGHQAKRDRETTDLDFSKSESEF